MLFSVLFVLFAFVAIFSAILVITAQHPVKAVLSLIVTFVATAGTWMLLQAEFLSLVLIVVYVGAVMVLFLFVVMMLDVEKAEEKASLVRYWPFAAGIALLFFVLLIDLVGHMSVATITPNWDFTQSNVLQVGIALFSNNIYPFEIAAVILLVAMIAAIALTFRGRNPSIKTQRISAQVRVQAKDRVKLVDIKTSVIPAKAGIQEGLDPRIKSEDDTSGGASQ